MSAKLAGVITIPKGSYSGSGEAVLFLNAKNKSICEKVMYLEDVKVEGDTDLESDEFHMPLKVMMSCWQAVVPSLNIYYDLIER